MGRYVQLLCGRCKRIFKRALEGNISWNISWHHSKECVHGVRIYSETS